MPTEKLLAGWAAERPTLSVHAEGAAADHARRRSCSAARICCSRSAASPAPSGRSSGAAVSAAADVQEGRPASSGVFELLPEGTRAAFEFRHPSWFDDEIYDALRAKNIALCVADSEKLCTPVEITADYGYFRLRDEGYQQADIESGQTRSASSKVCRDVFVYFKHEEQGLGPDFARRFIEASK